MLALRRLKNGDHTVMDGDNQLGVLGHKALVDHLKDCMGGSVQMSSWRIPGELPVDQEVGAKARKVMREEMVGYSKALRKVLASDRGLSERYYASHRIEIRD